MTLDTRALRLLVLASWSAFLLWLWLSGEVLLYLGPRTDWVVTFGGIALAVATAVYAYTTRDGPPSARPRAGELAEREGIHPGRPVRLVGFVSKPSAGRGEPFELSRFYITCCVADAIPVGVDVIAPGGRQPAKDEWLRVTGAVARVGAGFGIRAQRVTVIPRPAHPYLSFAGS